MRCLKKISALLIMTSALLMQSCFYDYPHPSGGYSPGMGEDPTTVYAYLELDFNLLWDSISHKIDTKASTRAATERPHRFIIEIADLNSILSHDVVNITDNEFDNGLLRHRISIPLEAKSYYISVWYDQQSEDGTYFFNADDLTNVVLSSSVTSGAEQFLCAHASDFIDLSDYKMEEEEYYVHKLSMGHSGARFEIVATDIQQFITNNRQALLDDDSFTVHISFSGGSYSSFNAFTNSANMDKDLNERSGHLRLPFSEYDELIIAEGFIFCREEDLVTATLSVTNNSLVKVAQLENFSFPVKRGHITTVSGDFLTNSVDGNFSINTGWEGEIPEEIE